MAEEVEQVHPQVAKAIQLAGGETALDGLLAAGKSLPAARIAELNRDLLDPARIDGAIRSLQTHQTHGRETDRMVAAGRAQSGKTFAMGGLDSVERARREAAEPLYQAVPAPANSKRELKVLMDRAQRGDAAAQQAVKDTPAERIMSWG